MGALSHAENQGSNVSLTKEPSQVRVAHYTLEVGQAPEGEV
jgi:hypothetical protein